jgi:hypothetical protein
MMVLGGSPPLDRFPSCGYEKCMFIKNSCPFDLWMDRSSIDDNPVALIVYNATLMQPGDEVVLDITAWVDTIGQRLYAWWINPVTGAYIDPTHSSDKVELYLPNSADIQYDATCQDYIALPVKLGPYFPEDCPNNNYVGTYNRTLQSVKDECFTLWNPYANWGTCRSSGYACYLEPYLPLCTALDPVINQCVLDGICPEGQSTEDVYDCQNWFAGQPGYCAAINRGVYPSLDQNDPSLFYKNTQQPFNEYAGWIHTDLAQAFTFPYDDYEGDNTAGRETCTTSSIYVEWCPAN